MSQHDMNIANQGFPAFRSDLNDALAALASTSAGATAPSTTFAQQLWYDSTANLLKMRNTDNDAWITLAYFDQTNDEWQIRSAVIQAVDSAGVVIKTDDGTTRIQVQDDGDVSIDSGTLFVDSANNRVGVGTSSPSTLLDVDGLLTTTNARGSETFSVSIPNGVATNVFDLATVVNAGGCAIVNFAQSSGAQLAKATAIVNRSLGSVYTASFLGTQPTAAYFSAVGTSGSQLQVTISFAAGNHTISGRIFAINA